MQALFMRHGHTNYNQLGLCNDDPNVPVHLTELGIKQAEAAAQKLKNVELQLIVTSQLPRTRQTADIINQIHHAPVIANAILNDIRSGFDSRPVADYFAATAADPLNLSVNDGESLLMHKHRVLPYLDWLGQRTEKIILTIAHEETLRVFYANAHQLPDSQLRELHFANCDYFELTL